MACALTTGRKLPCKESVGGLSAVFFGDYGTLGNLTTTGGEVTAISGSPTLFQYDLKGATSSLTTNVISSRDTGTTHYETTLEITLTHLDKATAEELKLIAKALLKLTKLKKAKNKNNLIFINFIYLVYQ